MHSLDIITGSTTDWRVQLLRYGVVGGVAFAVDFGLLWWLTACVSLHYVAAGTLGFTAGLAVNYSLSRLWVFTGPAVTGRTVEFLLFAAVGVVGLGLNAALLYVFTDVARCHYLLSKALATVIVFLWNFAGRRALMTLGNIPTIITHE